MRWTDDFWGINKGENLVKNWKNAKKIKGDKHLKENIMWWHYDTYHTHGNPKLIKICVGPPDGPNIVGDPDGTFHGTVVNFVKHIKKNYPQVTTIEVSDTISIYYIPEVKYLKLYFRVEV